MTIPTIDAIDAAIGAGETSYLDCCGGAGRTGTVVGCPCSSGEHGNANPLGLDHHETAREPIRVLAHQLEHTSRDC